MGKSAVSTKGFSELIQDMRAMPRKLENEVKVLTEATGRTIAYQAQSKAPVDTGKLRQNIVYEPTKGGFGAEVSVNVPYGIYVEMGTGGLVEVPAGFEDLASQFKGQGKRKINLQARPYLIPPYLVNADLYYQKVQRILDSLVK